ncbi:MAG: hypothetical protein ABS76_07630 [Pelagibacterium sp. SCN 64-44]|nr:MAG: hypothetical protein ABS76_07630 [Pelagibacterium sp. SCN 64-44]
MSKGYPTIEYSEEVMREGMQIENASIPVEDKVALLDALSQTGLKQIAVGSFVSPKYTPQMREIEAVLERFTPREGVIYTALVLNQKGRDRAAPFSPPLTFLQDSRPILGVHLCDVFTRRNTNRSQMDEMAAWPGAIRRAVERGVTESTIGVNAAFGSNFLGDFDPEVVIRFLHRQAELWEEADILPTAAWLGDPMGWCHPEKVATIFDYIKCTWPRINRFGLHLHNSRGMALSSAYAGIKALNQGDTLRMQGTLGGIGGCPYCGNGRATGMAATEDFLHMLDGMGIETGVDLDKIVECVWMLEEMIGRQGWGHVSRCGPRPMRPGALYDPNMPFVETVEEAAHFRKGAALYEGNIRPWKAAITSPYRDRVLRGEASYEPGGAWPWTESFFPTSDDVNRALTEVPGDG